MNKPEIVINIEDIYNRDKYNNINKKLLDKNDNNNNSYCCNNLFTCLFSCFL
jgi:hypothetical protein